ncbi:MAG: TIGR01777 family protein [Deltaproteobacteria bacterium]|nr:TIGR01777 family protein [Deltaproteobacteria bacterium]
MPRFTRETALPVPAAEAFAWHARPGAFERLTPPWEHIDVVAREGTIHDGDRLVMKVRKGPLRLTWEAQHQGFVAGEQFVDEQVRGPFAAWVHTHRMRDEPGGGSVLTDSIDYRLPLGPLGRLAGGGATRRMLERMFTYRHRQTRDDLAAHAAAASLPLTVAVSGASGLVGSALAPFLTTGGHRVRRLVRGAEPGADEILWSVRDGCIDAAALDGVDAVVHLAGAGIADARWTDARKALIRASRVDGTRLLATTLAGLPRRPRVLVMASAVGWYGDTGDTEVDESALSGEGFLADVVRDWEAAAAPAEDAGIRVVKLRLGVVLTAAGGALPKMAGPLRFGLGSRVGSGRQWMAWIARDDVVAGIHRALVDDAMVGVWNLVAPTPVREAELARTVARVLRRPALVPVPAFAARARFGEMADEALLASARVVPARLLAAGHTWRHPDLEGALRHELGRVREDK